jgi:transposase
MGEEVSEQLEYVPASLLVLEHVRAKLVCRACETIVAADPPAKPLDKGLPGPGLIAHIITSKYSEHLPLHRLESVFARHGVDLSRQTMCGWMARAAELLEPVVKRMADLVRQSAVIWTDDTTVPVRDPKLNKTRTGRLWVYIGDREHPYTVFDYTPNRSRDGPAAWLGEWRGYLQADAYAGYDALFAGGGAVEVACWAHARRKFHDARDSDAVRSHQALAFIARLYAVEREAKELCDEERRRLRAEKSAPVLAELFAWMEAQQRAVLPKSPMGEALAYALNHRAALERYCGDGRLSIDNNVSERALRRVAVGRKNWLFAGSDAGGRTAAVLYSLVATCREHGIDPFVYLRDVLLRIVTHPASRLDELLPDRWRAELLKSLDAPAPPAEPAAS